MTRRDTPAYLRRPAPQELGHFANVREGELLKGRASGSLGWAIVWGAVGIMVILLLADEVVPPVSHDAATNHGCYREGC